MKFLNYDKKTGNVTGFYATDIHGDNIPTGCLKISDDIWTEYLNNQGKYKIDLTKANALEKDTEIDKFEDLFVEIPINLDDVKAGKIQELSNACNSEILKGFYSDADGTNKLYDFDLENQVNLSAYKSNILLAKLSGTPLTTVSYYAKGESCHDYTADQFLKLVNDAETFKAECIAKYKDKLKPAVMACTTVDEVNAVKWDSESSSTSSDASNPSSTSNQTDNNQGINSSATTK